MRFSTDLCGLVNSLMWGLLDEAALGRTKTWEAFESFRASMVDFFEIFRDSMVDFFGQLAAQVQDEATLRR